MSPDNGRSSGRGVVTALFTGLAIGAILGVFFAPKSGKETRNDLMEKGERFMEMGRESVSDVVEKTKDLAESGKKIIGELKDAVK
ncbi:MAG: YtxH domain-containing protein [Candidatus Humimicrobiaceae bacterium]